MPCQSGPTSTHRIPVGIGWLTDFWFRKIIVVPLWLHYKTQYISHVKDRWHLGLDSEAIDIIGDLIKLLENRIKKTPRVPNPLPLLVQEEASPVNGIWASDVKCCTKAGIQFSTRVLNSSCLRPPFPRPGKGGWVVLTGSRIIFAMIIYSIRVSNHTSLALGRESSHVGAACVQDCVMQWKYFRNLTIPCQSGPTSTYRIYQ